MNCRRRCNPINQRKQNFCGGKKIHLCVLLEYNDIYSIVNSQFEILKVSRIMDTICNDMPMVMDVINSKMEVLDEHIAVVFVDVCEKVTCKCGCRDNIRVL